MNIRERYNIEEAQNSFSFYPYKTSVTLSRWFLIGIIAGVIILFLLQDSFDEATRWIIYILLVIFALYSLYDIQIRSKIKYCFDAKNNAVYKINFLLSKKKIMTLDQAVIFVQSEMGSWNYALGAKKSHFVKNYRISEGFGSGRKSLEIQVAYENFILQKIDKLIETVHFEIKK